MICFGHLRGVSVLSQTVCITFGLLLGSAHAQSGASLEWKSEPEIRRAMVRPGPGTGPGFTLQPAAATGIGFTNHLAEATVARNRLLELG